MIRVEHGDCLAVLPALAAEGVLVDSVVCDPPYHLISQDKRDHRRASPALNQREKITASKGFMGQAWDGGNIAFRPETWAAVMAVMRPGAHLIAFSGSRTYHRMACAIEDAGFEIRDQIFYCYGSGFPKSRNLGNGWGTALKPAHEPIVLARKPLAKGHTIAANVLAHGVGGLNIDACRIAAKDGDYAHTGNNLEHTRKGAADWRMPMQQVAPNALGRWPANLIHDGSDEVIAAFPDTAPSKPGDRAGGCKFFMGGDRRATAQSDYSDSGSAARFFYSSKADADDRCGSKHPTVKPTDLMAYLCRLVTPPGGLVLDPFAGSGSTGMACLREGFNAILIEREAEYVADIRRRIAHVSGLDSPLFGAAA